MNSNTGTPGETMRYDNAIILSRGILPLDKKFVDSGTGFCKRNTAKSSETPTTQLTCIPAGGQPGLASVPCGWLHTCPSVSSGYLEK
jgi:hypothetical protein